MGLTLWAINSEGAYESVGGRASWFSSNTAVATVSANGTARAVAAGTANITATYLGMTATAPILVVGSAQYPLLQIFSFSVPEVGRTNRVLVRYFQTPTTPARDVSLEATLTSSDPDVFSVESAQVTGRAPGTAILMATFGGAQASAYGSVPPLRSLP